MEILDPNGIGTVKIEYNPCVICLENVNIAVDFNTPRESETSESANYFTSDNNESLLKLLKIDIELPNVSNSRSKNRFLHSHDDNDVRVNEKFWNLNEENPASELFSTIEKEQHQGSQNKAHFYCDSCFVRNKEILRIYSEIEKLHKTFNGLRGSIEDEFKGGCIDDAEKFCELILDDSDGVYWRTLRHQFAKSFKLVVPEPEENYTENQDVFDYSEGPRIPSPSPTSPNSDCDADSFINMQYSHHRSTPDPKTNRQGTFENCIVKPGPTSTTTLPTFSLFPSSKASTSTSNSKISNSNLKNVVISIRKLPDHILPNKPVLINHSQTYPADLHRQQPLQKSLGPELEPDECESSGSRLKRNCVRSRAVKSYNDHQGFLDMDSEIFASDSDGDITVKKNWDNHPFFSKKKRNPLNTKEEETEKDDSSSSLTLKSTPKLRFFCTVEDCKRRKGFASLELLDIHTKESHEEISHPFKCPEAECKRSFRKFRDYKVHIETTHNKNYKYICHHCGKGFGISKNLRSHLGVHNTEPRYKCPDCPKALRSRAGLLAHRRTAHTGERPHQCHICGASFVTSFKLKNHIKCVHDKKGDRPHICDLCGKGFPIQGYLYFHLRNTHGKGTSRGDLDAAAGAGQEEPQQSDTLGLKSKSEQLISKSTSTVMLPDDDSGRIPQIPPEKETPVAPFYSPPLPPPLLPMFVEAPIPAPIISTTRPHNIPATTNFLAYQYMNLVTNLNVSENSHF